MDFTTLKSIQTVYPKYIKQYKDILLDPNSDVETKVDTIVQSLNRVSANEQQLVNNWNQVMQWAMNDGLDAAVSTQIAALEASGYFDSLLTSLFNSELGTETLATTSQDIKGAINEVKGVADSNTSALADITTHKADVSYVDTKLAGAVNASPIPVSLASNMTDHTRNYVYTGTEVGYTAGHWYGWNGSSWIDGGVYQTTGIADNSVKASNIKQIPEKSVSIVNIGNGLEMNLFDKSKVTVGSYIDSDGSVKSYGSNIGGISDYMPVIEGATYTFSNESGTSGTGNYKAGAWYDKNNAVISAILATSPYPVVLTVTAPANAAFLRINYTTTKIDTVMVVSGSSLPSYVPYGIKIPWLKFNVTAASINQLPEKSVSPINVYNPLEINMFDKTKVVSGSYIASNGTVTSYGSSVGGYSDYMPVVEGNQYTFNNESGTAGTGQSLAGAWYDKNKAWISTITGQGGNIVVTATAPTNARYLVINYTTTKLDSIMCVPGTALPASYVPYGVKIDWLRLPTIGSRWYGKKVNFLGDSITNGVGASVTANRYADVVGKMLGVSVNRNYGINGTLIAHDDTLTNAFVDRYSSMDSDADLVVVFGGTNDYFNGKGALGIETSTNPAEFYGALNVMIPGLITKYVGKDIVFITPYNMYYNSHSSDVPNTYSNATLNDYRNAILNRCEYYGVPVLDLFAKSGIDSAHSTDSRNAFTVDGVHPNDTGHTRVANRLAGFLNAI